MRSVKGIIGLIEDPEALCKWLIAGLEIASMVGDYGKDTLYFPNHAEKERHQHDTLSA